MCWKYVGSLGVLLLAAGAPAGCSSDPATPPGTDAGAGGDAVADTTTADGAALAITGTVTDRAGMPVARAKLEVGATSVFSDPQGGYTLAVPAAGSVTLKVTRQWFTALESSVTVASAGTTKHDVVLDEIPLKLDPDDVALAASYNKTFDFRTSKLSIAVAARPTRRAFDNAVFFNNPALFKEPAGQAAVKPTPLPDIGGAGAVNFSFVLKSGKNQGQDALDVTSIVDTLEATKLAAADTADFMVWTPALKWIGEWDEARFGDLTAAAAGIRQQDWGSGVARPQDIQRLYVDTASKTLWVEVVFASFVELGPGVTDNDGDGRKEIFAKLGSAHYTAAVADKLAGEYAKTAYTTHGLSNQVSKSLNDLYSQTAAQVERYIGEPLDLPGVGRIKYPFVVLTLLGGFKNVILVGP
jgi:hypothetical protein